MTSDCKLPIVTGAMLEASDVWRHLTGPLH